VIAKKREREMRKNIRQMLVKSRFSANKEVQHLKIALNRKKRKYLNFLAKLNRFGFRRN
jgi:hypothetical protein